MSLFYTQSLISKDLIPILLSASKLSYILPQILFKPVKIDKKNIDLIAHLFDSIKIILIKPQYVEYIPYALEAISNFSKSKVKIISDNILKLIPIVYLQYF